MDKEARPIFDSTIYEYVKSINAWSEPNEFHLMSYANLDEFKTLYIDLLSDYKHSKLLGIERFKNINITEGTTGAFLDWYITYGINNIYVLVGEYPFHYGNCIKRVDNIEALPNDSFLILSLPFSATGNIHTNYNEIIKTCEEKNIGVLLDCAYINISSIGEVNINSNAILSVATSLSKIFNTGTSNRIGLQLNLTKPKSPYQQLNDWQYVNHYSVNLHTKIMKRFGLSYVYDKYRDKQEQLCNKLNLDVSDTVIFGLSNDEKYKEYARGPTNRLCISRDF